MISKKNALWRFLYKLHRYLGLSSAIVLIMLAITGIILNHTDDFQLDSHMIQSENILNWYGITAPEPIAFAAGEYWLSQIDHQLFFDQLPLLKTQEQLLGAVQYSGFIVVALNQSFLLLSANGELIEQIPHHDLRRLGTSDRQQVIIETQEGLFYSDDGLLSWQVHNGNNVSWSTPSPLPQQAANSLKRQFRGGIVPLERVMLDVHSGRFFGKAGVFIVDLSGVFLLILALSGCAVWIKHKLRALRHRRKR